MTWRAVLAALAIVAVAACARVRPHQRQRLAHPAMQAPVWPAVDRADEHVREVREGSGGATTSGGGGCGCN
jgi:anti-sigma-K factor RskA